MKGPGHPGSPSSPTIHPVWDPGQLLPLLPSSVSPHTTRRGEGLQPGCLRPAWFWHSCTTGPQAAPAAHVHTHQPVGDSCVVRINPEFQWLV